VADFSFGGLAETLAIRQWRWAQWRKLDLETAVLGWPSQRWRLGRPVRPPWSDDGCDRRPYWSGARTERPGMRARPSPPGRRATTRRS